MAKTTGSYAARIQRVVDYAAEHLDETLDLEAMARVAHLPPYHFHRIYRGVLGETAGDTVRRLRLYRSAIDLLDRGLSVERVARRAGYASQAAFTRAFQDEYGDPTARYRGAREKAVLEIAANPNLYRVEISVLRRLRVAAIHQLGNIRLASKAFERLMTFAATTGLLASDTQPYTYDRDTLIKLLNEALAGTRPRTR